MKDDAERCINTTNGKTLPEYIRAATKRQPVFDVILDIIGAAVLDKEIDCLADEGRLVLIAYLGGRLGTVDLAQIVHRQLMVTGSTLRPRSNEFKAEIARNLQKHIWPLIDEGKIKPVIYKVFPLADAMLAQKLMQSNTHFGKIVLQVI